MVKAKISKPQETSSPKRDKELRLEDFEGITKDNPLDTLANEENTGKAILECLQNNDPEGVMEVIENYLYAVNKKHLREEVNLRKSTLYATLQHRNPTIKTLAKLMYSRTHWQGALKGSTPRKTGRLLTKRKTSKV